MGERNRFIHNEVKGSMEPWKKLFPLHSDTHAYAHTVASFHKTGPDEGGQRESKGFVINHRVNGKWGKAYLALTSTHTHVHAHMSYLYTNARAHVHFRGQEDDANLSVSLPPHDTDDQDRARAIRTRRWRRQLFCGTNRARAPRPWRTYSTPSWDCHPRRVPRVLARGDPSWPPRPPSAIAIRTLPSARRKPGRAAATYAKTSKVGGLCKFSFWTADPI